MSDTNRHAIVIGASMAGLLAARALSETFESVTVLDRDDLPDEPVARGGVPQSRHTHGLLARGREALEELFPGVTEDLVAEGALVGDLLSQGRWFHGSGRLVRAESGLVGVAVSRQLLERYVRRRVEELDVVAIVGRTAVLDLRFDASGSRVTGVVAADREDVGVVRSLDADLVVDASGRTSRMPEWLARRGYPEPREETVRVDVAYATRTFRRAPTDADGDVAMVYAATPEEPRAAALVAQEGDRWIASICGYHGDRPPVDLEGFRRHAAALTAPDMAEVVASAEPLDDGAVYRFPANRRRRYERLKRFPAGLLVTGDAVCSFDPVYGQGMTVSAVEALTLRDLLAAGPDRIARRFFRRIAHVVDVPWSIAVGGDLALPGASDPVPIATRLSNRYVTSFLRAAEHDPALARAFLRVANLLDRPEALMAPRHLARVVRPSRRRQPAPARAEVAVR